MASNYKLNPSTQLDIVRGISGMCWRRAYHQADKFPLSYNDVQEIILPEVPRKLVSALVQEWGFDSVERHTALWFTFEDPGCPRAPVIWVEAKPGLFEARRPTPHYRRHDRVLADLSVLPEAKREALIIWSNKVVEEMRYKKFVENLMLRAFDFMPTLWHLMLRWPTLQLGFDAGLKGRAGTPPLRRGLYKWDYPNPVGGDVWYREHKRQIDLADTIILAAELMPPVEAKPLARGQVRAKIADWYKLPDDQV